MEWSESSFNHPGVLYKRWGGGERRGHRRTDTQERGYVRTEEEIGNEAT